MTRQTTKPRLDPAARLAIGQAPRSDTPGRFATLNSVPQDLARRGHPLARLRHHVTGAIERGEAFAIVEQPVAS